MCGPQLFQRTGPRLLAVSSKVSLQLLAGVENSVGLCMYTGVYIYMIEASEEVGYEYS